MRCVVLAIVLAAAPAAADDTPQLPHVAHGWAADFQSIDIAGGQAIGAGADATFALGKGRLALLVEVGLGGLLSTHPTDAVGGFFTTRGGGRVLAASFREEDLAVDLVLDAGIGQKLYWLDTAGVAERPFAFAGWGTILGGEHHGFHLDLRFEVSPRDDDPAIAQVVCRGTCTMRSSEPVDLTIQFLFGVMSW